MTREQEGWKQRTQGSTATACGVLAQELACDVLSDILSYLPLRQRLGGPALVSKSFHTACMKSLAREELVSFRKCWGGKKFDKATRCWAKYACVPPRIRIANPSNLHLHALSRCASNIRGLSLAHMNANMLFAIPDALACLSCLEELSIAVENDYSQKDLNINTITIPHLPQLTSLAVSYTALKNLYGLTNFPRLSVLKIKCNSLENVSWPSNLLELYAYVSECSSSVASSLVKKLTKLTRLDGGYMLEDILLHSHAPFYQTLRECSGSLSTDILQNMEHMTNLHVLSLSGAANLTPDGVCSIARIVSLQELCLNGAYISLGDADLAPLRQLVNLETLKIFNFNYITSAFLSDVASLPRLRTLKLRFCSGIKSLAPLQACRCLTYLVPPDVVTEANAVEISRITTLETVWNCEIESEACLTHLCKLPHVRRLHVMGNYRRRHFLTCIGLQALSTLPASLEALHLADFSNARDALPVLAQLKSLRLLCLGRLTEKQIEWIGERLPLLRPYNPVGKWE